MNLFVNNKGELDITTDYATTPQQEEELDMATNLLQCLRTYIESGVSECAIDNNFGMPYNQIVSNELPIEPYLQKQINYYEPFFKSISYLVGYTATAINIALTIDTYFNGTINTEV